MHGATIKKALDKYGGIIDGARNDTQTCPQPFTTAAS